MKMLRLSWALCALTAACSPDVQETKSLRTKISLDASAKEKSLTQWSFQTFEDQAFNLSDLSPEWSESSSLSILSPPKLGKLIYDGALGAWVYVPGKDMSGDDRFEIQINSENSDPKVYSVYPSIIPVNDAPVTHDITLKLPEDSKIDFSLSLLDPEQDKLSVNVSQSVAYGQLKKGNDDTFSYEPKENFSGLDTFTYLVSDGKTQSQGQVRFEVLSVEDDMVASDGLFELNSGSQHQGQLSWVDPESQTGNSTINIISYPQKGSLTINDQTSEFLYTSDQGFYGRDSFEFEVVKGHRKSNKATVTLQVKYHNQPPYHCVDDCKQDPKCDSHKDCSDDKCDSHKDCSNDQCSCTSHDCSSSSGYECKPDDQKQWDQVIFCPRQGPCTGKLSAIDPDSDKISYILSQNPSHGSFTSWDRWEGSFIYLPKNKHPEPAYDSFTFWLRDCYQNKSREYRVKIEFIDQWSFLKDSFERSQVFTSDTGFHWRYMLDDNGKGLQNSDQECKDHVCAKIFKQSDGFGPMADQDRGLFLFGREGYSTHDIFLVSKSFDLSQYNSVEVDFSFLPVDIGDNDHNSHQSTHEYLKVEVCLSGDKACGLSPVDPYKLKSDLWQTVFVHDGTNNGFDGRSHSLHDWQKESFKVSLQDLESKHDSCHRSQFSFRFSSRLQDGFDHNQYHNRLRDAVLIDQVELKASK